MMNSEKSMVKIFLDDIDNIMFSNGDSIPVCYVDVSDIAWIKIEGQWENWGMACCGENDDDMKENFIEVLAEEYGHKDNGNIFMYPVSVKLSAKDEVFDGYVESWQCRRLEDELSKRMM